MRTPLHGGEMGEEGIPVHIMEKIKWIPAAIGGREEALAAVCVFLMPWESPSSRDTRHCL